MHTGRAGGTSSSTAIGIVIGVLTVGFIIIMFGYLFGRDYWRKRHTYSWYNTLTTPSSWCDCDCDCFSGGESSWQSSRTPHQNIFQVSSSTIKFITMHDNFILAHTVICDFLLNVVLRKWRKIICTQMVTKYGAQSRKIVTQNF